MLLMWGCSSFEGEWERVLPGDIPAAPPSIAGCWEGTWHSDGNGHEGSLRCIMTSKGDALEAHYHATFALGFVMLSFDYTLPMTAVPEEVGLPGGAAYKVRGSAVLGYWIGGGRYDYEGRIEKGEYQASYRSSQDHGVFTLKRVK
jgi:hypothetical protein